MAENDEPTEGAAGEPTPDVAPVADGSQPDIADILKSLETATPPATEPKKLDENLVKQLESLDPRELPDSLRNRFEAPFLSNMTKKTTEFDTERKRLLDVIDKLTSRPAGTPEPTPDQKAVLLQKLSEGDAAGVEQIINSMVEARTAPIVRQGNMESATRIAASLEPSIRELEPEVAKAISDNPQFGGLLYQVSANNPELAGFLLAGAARAIKADRLAGQLKALQDSMPTKVKAAIDEYQKRLKGLPSSTSKAGASPSRVPNDDEFDRVRIRDEAWTEAGGR